MVVDIFLRSHVTSGSMGAVRIPDHSGLLSGVFQATSAGDLAVPNSRLSRNRSERHMRGPI
jgi:hypothetical protein